MEDKVWQAYLYDFYGELLNDHQRSIYEDFIFNDLSLTEIAEERGISRQGVHDMIHRCTKALTGYEDKLHLVAKFIKTKEMVTRVCDLTGQFKRDRDDKTLDEIEEILNRILEEM